MQKVSHSRDFPNKQKIDMWVFFMMCFRVFCAWQLIWMRTENLCKQNHVNFCLGFVSFFSLVPFERSSAYIGKWVTLHSCCIRVNAQLYCSVSHIVNGHLAKRWRKIFYLTAGENVSLYFIYGSHEFIASFKLKALLF